MPFWELLQARPWWSRQTSRKWTQPNLSFALTHGPVASYCAEAQLSLLPSLPLPCAHIALAASRPEHSYLLYISHHVIAWPQHNGVKKTENILDMDFLWLISCCFGHKRPSHIPGFATQRNMIILHVHVVQSCMSNQAKEVCLSMVRSTHISQTNWNLEVEQACSWGWPALGTFTHVPCCLHFFMMDSTELQGCSGSLFLYPSPD